MLDSQLHAIMADDLNFSSGGWGGGGGGFICLCIFMASVNLSRELYGINKNKWPTIIVTGDMQHWMPDFPSLASSIFILLLIPLSLHLSLPLSFVLHLCPYSSSFSMTCQRTLHCSESFETNFLQHAQSTKNKKSLEFVKCRSKCLL